MCPGVWLRTWLRLYLRLGAQLNGELRKWHKVTLTFEGSQSAKDATPNPFMDFRLNVRFTHIGSGQSLLVPGCYAADGDAANTSADTGNKWRAHFAPAQTGRWMYVVSSRQGKNVAVDETPDAGESAGFMDGLQAADPVEVSVLDPWADSGNMDVFEGNCPVKST